MTCVTKYIQQEKESPGIGKWNKNSHEYKSFSLWSGSQPVDFSVLQPVYKTRKGRGSTRTLNTQRKDNGVTYRPRPRDSSPTKFKRKSRRYDKRNTVGLHIFGGLTKDLNRGSVNQVLNNNFSKVTPLTSQTPKDKEIERLQ